LLSTLKGTGKNGRIFGWRSFEKSGWQVWQKRSLEEEDEVGGFQ
jgi:hypothetical protein